LSALAVGWNEKSAFEALFLCRIGLQPRYYLREQLLKT
jgi:hypothetical protein